MLGVRFSSPTCRISQLERSVKADAETVGPTHPPTCSQRGLMPVHAQKNQSLTDLLQAKPKKVQGRKFHHTRTVLPDILELRKQNGAHYVQGCKHNSFFCLRTFKVMEDICFVCFKIFRYLFAVDVTYEL
jgi:hypothetical protein